MKIMSKISSIDYISCFNANVIYCIHTYPRSESFSSDKGWRSRDSTHIALCIFFHSMSSKIHNIPPIKLFEVKISFEMTWPTSAPLSPLYFRPPSPLFTPRSSFVLHVDLSPQRAPCFSIVPSFLLSLCSILLRIPSTLLGLLAPPRYDPKLPARLLPVDCCSPHAHNPFVRFLLSSLYSLFGFSPNSTLTSDIYLISSIFDVYTVNLDLFCFLFRNNLADQCIKQGKLDLRPYKKKEHRHHSIKLKGTIARPLSSSDTKKN